MACTCQVHIHFENTEWWNGRAFPRQVRRDRGVHSISARFTYGGGHFSRQTELWTTMWEGVDWEWHAPKSGVGGAGSIFVKACRLVT